jgi:WhiB family redox-sensing transcriptional regulator
MTSTLIADPLPPGEWARHPASLAEEAHRDGWVQRLGGLPATFPRQLNSGELTAWTRGHAAAHEAVVCVRRADRPLHPAAAAPEPRMATAPADTADQLVELLELAPPPPPVAPYFDGTQVCAQIDPELWFPEKGGNNSAAKELCTTCDFQVACLRYALGERIYGMPIAGIWGGTSVQERKQLLRAAAAGVLDLVDVVPADVDLLGDLLDEEVA